MANLFRRTVLRAVMLGLLLGTGQDASAFEGICRAIGIGHGPGYHASSCPGCCGNCPGSQGVYSQVTHPMNPAAARYFAKHWDNAPMEGYPGAVNAEPITTPPRRADGVELGPGEVLVKPPADMENQPEPTPAPLPHPIPKSTTNEASGGRGFGYGVPANGRALTASGRQAHHGVGFGPGSFGGTSRMAKRSGTAQQMPIAESPAPRMLASKPARPLNSSKGKFDAKAIVAEVDVDDASVEQAD